MKAPIETKVIAAASGAGLGGAFGTFVLWFLGCLAWGAPWSADKATQAVAAVPEPVGALTVILVALVGSAIGGYEAPHTPRPDLHPAKSAADSTSGEAPAASVEAAPAVSTPAEPEAPAAGTPPADAPASA